MITLIEFQGVSKYLIFSRYPHSTMLSTLRSNPKVSYFTLFSNKEPVFFKPGYPVGVFFKGYKIIRGMKFSSSSENKRCEFFSPEFDFAQASQSVRDGSVLIFYTQKLGRNSDDPNKLVLPLSAAVNRGFSCVGAILETSL